MVPACSGPLSTLDPAGPAASSIAELWWVMLIGAVILFVLVIGLLALAFLPARVAADIPTSIWLVGGGLVLPAIVLTPLMAFALVRGELLLPARDGDSLQIDVLARQWEWVFIYRPPGRAPARSVNVLHVPAGQPVRLNITSADVVHSFWVPRLAGKIDATPGHITTLQLIASRPGTYRGACAEFCGTAHWEMQMSVQAHELMSEFHDVLDRLPQAAAGDLIPRGRTR